MTKKIFAAALLAAAVCLTGCAKEEQQKKEMNIFREPSVMQEWMESLPKTDGQIHAESIRGVSVESGSEEVFNVAYSPKEYKSSFAYWEMSAPYPCQTTVNTETFYTLLGSLDEMQLLECASQETQENTGISDSGDYITVALSSSGEDAADEIVRYHIGQSDGNGHVYASAEGSGEVGLLPEEKVSALLNADPYDYILKVPVLPDITTVSDVEAEKGEELYTMSSRDGKYQINSKDAEQEEYSQAYQKLLGVLITGKLPDGYRAGTDEEPLLTVRFFRNIKEASDIEVSYYPYDDSSAAVCINGTEYFLADRSEIENLAEELF